MSEIIIAVVFSIILLLVLFLYVFLYMRRNKVVRTDEYIICNHARDEGIIDAYEKKKKKTNAVMLNSIPKWVCIAMILITITQVIGICYLYHTNKCTQGIFEITLADLLSVGIGIIAIAVSVWVGLNIYIAFSREENEKLINDMKDELEKAENETLMLKDESEKILGTVNDLLKQELINTINRTSVSYMMSTYLANLFEQISLAGVDEQLIRRMIIHESKYVAVTLMYENERHLNSIVESEKVRLLYENDLNAHLNRKKTYKDEFGDEVIEVYLNVRIADTIFYRNASILRHKNNKARKTFSMEDMDKSVEIYKEMREFVCDHAPEYKDKAQTLAFIDNTIGYTYDLMNQITHDEERAKEAVRYMEDAVKNIDYLWADKKARYLRNLGLTYEHIGDLEKAKKAYEDSSKCDATDY